MTKRRISVVLLGCALWPGVAAHAQQEGPIATQALVGVEPKSKAPASASELTVSVNNRKEALSSWAPVLAGNAQVALLIDDGLRTSVGRELGSLRAFVAKLTPGVEILVGYMNHGSVDVAQAFTTDHTAAAATLHVPEGIPGASASPYLCLSDFVKKWPDTSNYASSSSPVQALPHKARFVLMISNGVDPYNGSTSVMNQDSPYVSAAVLDAQRAGVAVYSIYFGDAGMGGASVDFSGQSYLSQLAQGTGGVNYYEGTGNPVSMAPFLSEFERAVAESYIATFDAPAGKDPRDLVRLKLTAAKAKLHAPEQVRAGNVE